MISEGLALELSCGSDHELWAFDNFFVEITLTKKGLTEYKKVINAVFAYAKVVHDKGP